MNIIKTHWPILSLYAGLIGTIGFLAPKEDTTLSQEIIALTIVAALLDLWMRASLLLHIRALVRREERSFFCCLWWGFKRAPLLLLYWVVHLFASLMGLLLLILPGLLVYSVTALVPPLALLAPDGEESWWRRAWRLAKANPGRVLLIAWLPIIPIAGNLVLLGMRGGSPELPWQIVFSYLEGIAWTVSSVACVLLIENDRGRG